MPAYSFDERSSDQKRRDPEQRPIQMRKLANGMLLLALLAWSRVAAAQQPAPPPTAQPRTNAPASDPEKGDDTKPKTSIERETGTNNDRIFEVVPNYGTVRNTKTLPAMSTGQKFRLATAGSFDYFAYPFNALLAGIGQADNAPPSWGQGWGAYAKRFASSFADNTISSYMTTAVYPSLLKEDPRYYRMAQGKFSRRLSYPISRLFVTRTDAGNTRCNFSELFGNATAAGISNLYHPAEDRTLSRNLGTLGMLYMWDGVSNEMKEFWPDIRRKVLHKDSH